MLATMMSISEMQLLSATVNATWQSPVGDAAAARWGVAAGQAIWWRSSGFHVFALPPDERNPQRFLRLAPDRHRSRQQVAVVAAFASELAHAGIRLATPLPSAGGELVESIDTGIGLMHACVVEGAPGEQIDVEELTEDRAHAWGSALAQIHVAGRRTVGDLPDARGGLQILRDDLGDDPEVIDVVTRLVESLDALPTTPEWFGPTHGDFELDNMAWVDDVPTCFDFDDAAVTWFAADVANAVGDLTILGRPRTEYRQHVDAFVGGYRAIRHLPTEQLDTLPLHAAADVVRRLVDLRRALIVDPRAGDEMESLQTLRSRLEQVAATLRADLLTAQF